MIVAGAACPRLRAERLENRRLAHMIDAIVGELDEQRIGRLQSRAGQREEQAGRARHAAKQPTASHIRIKPDGDLRHGHA